MIIGDDGAVAVSANRSDHTSNVGTDRRAGGTDSGPNRSPAGNSADDDDDDDMDAITTHWQW